MYTVNFLYIQYIVFITDSTMGILSSSISLTRYRVAGILKPPVIETVATGLGKHTISEIDNDTTEKIFGWTSFDRPFRPNFKDRSFVIGSHFVFSLRLDKKTISSGMVNKHCAMEIDRRTAEKGLPFLSRDEKRRIREHVTVLLSRRVPATPMICDVIWEYKAATVWFLSRLKSACESLETLFLRSFNIGLIPMIPYSSAYLTAGLSDDEKDRLTQLSPTPFVAEND